MDDLVISKIRQYIHIVYQVNIQHINVYENSTEETKMFQNYDNMYKWLQNYIESRIKTPLRIRINELSHDLTDPLWQEYEYIKKKYHKNFTDVIYQQMDLDISTISDIYGKLFDIDITNYASHVTIKITKFQLSD